jgi:hypothetical protein
VQNAGVPAAVVCTDVFAPMGKVEAEQLGMPELPLLVIRHPLGGLPAAEVERRVDETLARLAAAIPKAPNPTITTP